jgi:hypothetical protein
MGPELSKTATENLKDKKPADSQADINKLKTQAEQQRQDKEANEKRNFDGKRVVKKATTGVLIAVLVSVLIVFALFRRNTIAY